MAFATGKSISKVLVVHSRRRRQPYSLATVDPIDQLPPQVTRSLSLGPVTTQEWDDRRFDEDCIETDCCNNVSEWR